MAEYRELFSRHGRLYYTPLEESNEAHTPRLFQQPRRRYCRPSLITISNVSAGHGLEIPRPGKKNIRTWAKLAGSRDNAFRFLRSVIAQHSASAKFEHDLPASERTKVSHPLGQRDTEDMPSVDLLRPHSRTVGLGSSPLARPALQNDSRTNSTQSGISVRGHRSGSEARIPEEKPIAAGNGVSISVNLAEPVLFLQGYDPNDTSSSSTAMLRGSLRLKIQKSAKIKSVTLKFKGTATTRWPEGIPPKKVDFEETDTLMSHTWPFFNAQFPTAEDGSCADLVRLASTPTATQHAPPYLNSSPQSTSLNVSARDAKRLSIQTVHSRSFEREEKKSTATVAQRGYRTFYPGDYMYNFELPLDGRLPETIDVDLGFVKYELEAMIERAGAFRANLVGTKEVTLIRAPSEGSLEQVEPIAISRNWEDQLHYDIVISGKSFPLGSKIPIAFKLTPLAKVHCHRIKVMVTENIEYFCSDKRVHRMEPTRNVLLFEKRADGTASSTFPGSTYRTTAGGGIPYDRREAAARGEQVIPQDTSNLLGHLEGESNIGPTEMEFTVQLPGCQQTTDKERTNKLRFDTTYQNIQVHHWIKIVIRLSRPDAVDPIKRRHFEISIDSPLHILSCRANQANTALPAYSSPESGPNPNQSLADCNCPGAPRHRPFPNYVPTFNSLSETPTVEGSPSSSSTTLASADTSISETSLPIRPMLARPPTAHLNGMTDGHVQRPIHMLRAPSFNPPAFDDEDPPPPLATPPPHYADIASPTIGHGLQDYFSRFHDAYEDEEEDDSDERRSNSRGRVNLPLTPGGRLNRSMEFGRREWEGRSPGGT